MIAPRRLLSAVILSALVGIVLGVPSAAAQQDPNTPDPPSVVAKSKTALTVTWTAPTGPAVASYDVQYRKSTEMNWTNGPQDQTRTRADITGLDADTFYDVQVRATNAAGDSGWSDDAQGATALFEADLTVGRHSAGGFTHQVGYRRGHPAASSNLYPPDEMGHGMLTSSELTYSGVTYTIDAIRRDNRENRLVIGYSSDAVRMSGGQTLPAASFWPRDWDITFFQTEEIEQFSTAISNPGNQIQAGILNQQLEGGYLNKRPHIGAIWDWDRNNLPWTVDQTYSMTIARVQRADTTVTISADSPDVTLNPTSLTIPAGMTQDTVMLTATLSGTSSADTTVTISADPPDVTLIPDSLTIPAGETAGTVTLTVILPQTNHPPVFPSPETSFSVNENTPPGQDIGIPVTAFDDGGERLTYTLDGPDAAAFDLFVANQFRTKAELDYETKDSYRFVVSVRDSRNAAGEADTETDDTIEVTITAVDLDEAGTVTLTGTPAQLREELTAALHDDDGRLIGITWQWARSGITWTDIDMATSERYTPEAGDLGKHLRATATYTDRYGSGKSASTTTTAVQAPPGMTLHLSPSSINEDGGQSTLTVGLDRPSSQATTVTVSAPAGDVTLSNNRTLTIAAGKTESTGTVTLTAVDNDGDGPETKQVQVSGQRNNPLATEPAPVTLTITDDDTAPTVTMVLPDAITENAGMGTLAVMLSHPSSAATAVEVSVDIAEAVTLRPNSLTISVTASADLPAPPAPPDPPTVTLRPNSLTIPAGETEGTVMLTVTLSEASNVDRLVTLSADLPPDLSDPPDVTLSPDSLTIPAGETEGSVRLTAELSEASSADTPVTVSADPAAAVTLSPNSLTIPAGMTRGTVTLTAVDDNTDALNKQVTVSGLASNAHGIAGNPEPRTLRIQDDDPAPTVTLELAQNPIGENGGQSTLTVGLDRPSSQATTVTVSADPAAVRLSPNSLTIPARMTSGTGTLTVTAAELTITDNDTRGVTVSEQTLSIKEGGNPDTYTVVLASEPTGSVTIAVASSDAAVRVNPPSLGFTAANWQTAQTVTVDAANDEVENNPPKTATITHTVSGGDYAGVPAASVAVTVTDDESPSTTVTLSVSPAAVREGAGNRTVTVTGELNGKPRSAATVVTVSVTAGTATADTDFSVSPVPTLTIAEGRPSGTMTFALTPVNDTIGEPDETVTVGGSTTVGLAVTEATLTIEDNDGPPAVELVLSANPISEDETTQVTATLSHPSSADTTVEVSAAVVHPTSAGDIRLSGTSLTIPAGARESSTSATLWARDNPVDEADKQVSVRGRAENPQGVQSPNVGPVTVTITDDDPPEVTGETFPEYVEGGSGPVATYTASNPANVRLMWSVIGTDAEFFTIANGVLRFKQSPDYEDPNNLDKEYAVTVQASDETDPAGPLAVTVEVLDALGKVELPPSQPQVEVALTATLSDLDGLHPDPVPPNEERWCWQRSRFPTFLTIPGIECIPDTTDTYTPVDADLDHYLRVTVLYYTDGQETRKADIVVAAPDEPVRATADEPPEPAHGGGGGGGPSAPAPPPEPVGYLENPGTAATQSGIGVISGWVCEAAVVEIELNGVPQEAAYGTERLDTEPECGDTDNGFGLLFNWNLLGDGVHEVVAFVDGAELTRTTVTVTTLGMEFLRDVTGTCEATDFPLAGEHVTLVWQQAQQNFAIADGEAPRGADRAGAIQVGYLENPGPNSFQSGIGVISGWVCEAETVEIVLNGEAQPAAYGTERLDTLEACGDTDNGFGLLFNWNLLGEGEHTVVARVDGEELGRATVRVTTLGTEFLRSVAGECEAEGFPMPGETVTLEWQQNSQNFVITDIE